GRVVVVLSALAASGRWMGRVPATRALVRGLVAGTTTEDALAVLEGLNARGLMGAVTYLGENVATPADAERATQTYLHLLDEIKQRNLNVLPSLKLTHLGLDLGQQVCVTNLTAVPERARAAGTRVWVDMDSSVYTDRLLAPDALARGAYTGFATHDDQMLAHVRDRVRERRLASGRWEIQMLYGIRPEMPGRLAAEGLPVRVLVPFGEDWYGYFMRRLAERPANLLFFLKNVARSLGLIFHGFSRRLSHAGMD